MKKDIDYIISLMKKYTTSNDKNEIDEQGGAESGGGGGSGDKKPDYPNVTKWTSGRKFGPTYNPEVKTWTTGLTRGKANTLL